MGQRNNERIVDFTYCQRCLHKDLSEMDEPCFDCLENPVNVESIRPIHFKDNGKQSKNGNK